MAISGRVVLFLKDVPEDVYTGTLPIVRCLPPGKKSDRYTGNANGKGNLLSLSKEVFINILCETCV